MHPTVIYFELGYIFNILGIVILVLHIRAKKHIEGISFYTQLIFCIAAYAKLLYMPNTVLKEYAFCWIEFLASLVLSAVLMYQLKKYKRLSFTKESNFFDWRLILLASAILAFVSTYEKDHAFEVSQYAIRFSIISEAIGLLPQLRLMKLEKFVPRYFGWYLLAILANRVSRLGFWWHQVRDNYSRDSYYTLILADFVYIVLTADFAYNFLKHRNNTLIPYA